MDDQADNWYVPDEVMNVFSMPVWLSVLTLFICLTSLTALFAQTPDVVIRKPERKKISAWGWLVI